MQSARPVKTAHHFGAGFNGRAALFLSRVVLTMWTFWASVVLMAAWMLGLGLTVAGDAYPYNLMLLAVGGIAQWLVMIALGVQGNAAAAASDRRSEAAAHNSELSLANQAQMVAQLARIEDCISSGR